MQSSNSLNPSDLGSSLGFLLLRLWLGLRAIGSGIEKFAGYSSSQAAVVIDGEPNTYGLVAEGAEKTYGFAHYSGVPTAMYDTLLAEPLIPGFALTLYDFVLGPALLLLGLTVLLGVLPRISLFLMGLLYTSLTFGLILLHQDGGVAWLATHIVLVAMALFTIRFNRWSVFPKW